MDKLVLDCLEILQPIGKYYLTVINHQDLIKISQADIRRLEKGKRELVEYTGIQRPLQKNRVKDIGKYVNLIDATFPTNIILAISSENASYDASQKILTIEHEDNVAKILDGQHRIAGLKFFKDTETKFELTVAIFIDLDIEDQAQVFATINKTQTKVNKSLVADLYAFAKSRSPQRTAHVIARALNQKDGSPFKDKIKILGSAEDAEKETITQATFVDSLLKYISSDPLGDRDVYRRGKELSPVSGHEAQRYFFRNFFIYKLDSDIAQVLMNYFSAVRRKWPTAWNEVIPNMILNRSTGFIALMRLLRNIYPDFQALSIPSTDNFYKYFEDIDVQDDYFSKDEFFPGSTGQGKLTNFFKENIKHG